MRTVGCSSEKEIGLNLKIIQLTTKAELSVQSVPRMPGPLHVHCPSCYNRDAVIVRGKKCLQINITGNVYV